MPIDTIYIDEDTDYEKINARYRFDYSRGKWIEGVHGNYDLTKGHFSCFSREKHTPDGIKSTIDAMYSGKKNDFHALMLLGTIFDIRTQYFFQVVGLLEK